MIGGRFITAKPDRSKCSAQLNGAAQGVLRWRLSSTNALDLAKLRDLRHDGVDWPASRST